MMNQPKFIIVIGTSAGGNAALAKLVAQFKTGMDAAIFIVMHLPSTTHINFLSNRLQPSTALKCVVPQDGEKILKDHIYITPVNQHLLVRKNEILLGDGPEENRFRPSIDVLFRSAAAAYNSKVVLPEWMLLREVVELALYKSPVKQSIQICHYPF